MIQKRKKRCSQYGITVRIVILFTALVIVPFLIVSIVIAVVFQNYMVSNIGANATDLVSSVGSQIKGALKEYEEDSMSLYYNGYVEYLEKGGNLDEYEKKQIQDDLVSSCFSDTTVHAIYVITQNEVFHGGAHYTTLEQIMEPYQEEILEDGGACRWYYTNRLQGNAKENKYILARSLNSRTKENIGILYMVVDDSMVKNAYQQMKQDEYTRYLVTGGEEILYSTDEKQFGKKLDISSIDPELISSYQKTEIDGEEQILIARHLPDVDWYCVSTISTKDIYHDIIELEYPFIIIAIIYILFLFFMLQMMKRYVFQPLRVLKDNMDRYAQGALQAMNMQSVGVGEFESLSGHFNDMTQRINRLMTEYKNEVDEKNRQRMKALTSQLTPHFIYNALNTIKWMAVLNHQVNIQSLTESLIHIFMNAAKVDDENYTLSDELELVSNYAVIQKARFMNFDLKIEADGKTRNCIIRKFLLQPIVENAIVHGLGRGKIKNTEIFIKAWTDANLHITVCDEGIGFDVEKWRASPGTDAAHTNIGLYNVEQIIHLEYGSPYRLEIKSTPGSGTVITYILPAVQSGAGQEGESRDTDYNCGR